jgi:threonine dehydrogenase-like Zn-dependent dehydrogenase
LKSCAGTTLSAGEWIKRGARRKPRRIGTPGGNGSKEVDYARSGEELFFAEVHLHGGPAPVRRFLPELIELIWDRKIDPSRVFDLEAPPEQVAEGYCAMDERRAIKALRSP